MKTKMKNPQKTQKPLKLSKGLNPKTPTSANPGYGICLAHWIDLYPWKSY